MKHVTQRQATEAALTNEYLTRQRVETLERQSRHINDRLVRLERERAALKCRLFGRLRWLVLGR
jgi:hypothetical protein